MTRRPWERRVMVRASTITAVWSSVTRRPNVPLLLADGRARHVHGCASTVARHRLTGRVRIGAGVMRTG